MPELLVSQNIITPRLERALYKLNLGFNPIVGRLHYLLQNDEASLIKEVAEAWKESKVGGR